MAVLTAVLAPVALAQSPGLEPPERPQGLRAEVSHDTVSLSWDDPGDATISGYQILRRDRDRSPVGVFEVLVEDSGSAAAAYADRQVQPETRYNYRVKARNAAGLSRRSNFVRADTPAAPEEALKKAIEGLPEEAGDGLDRPVDGRRVRRGRAAGALAMRSGPGRARCRPTASGSTRRNTPCWGCSNTAAA